MRTKKKLFILYSFLIIAFIFGFYFRFTIINFLTSVFLGQGFTRESVLIDIKDVSKPSIDTISIKLPEKTFINKLEIEAKGELSDTVIINDDIVLLPGVVDTFIKNGDWYEPQYILKYDPNVSTHGHLQFKFTFYGSWANL